MQRVLSILVGLFLCQSLRAQCPNGTPPPCARSSPVSGIAVLYFENASRDTNFAYLADGLTESLIDRLAQAGIHVASRFQVRRVRGNTDPVSLASTLGVDHVLTGTIRPMGSALRMAVELVRLPSGTRVWGRQFDRKTSELLDIETELAAIVADSVAGRFLRRQPREVARARAPNPAAYDHYQRGRFFLGQRTPPAILRAIQELETATRLDPRPALLRAQLSLAYGVCFAHCRIPDSTRRSMLVRSIGAADLALRLDSSSAAAWTAKATAVGIAAASGILDSSVSMAAATRYASRAIQLDSSYAEAWHSYGDGWLFLGDDTKAELAFKRALALEPGSGEYLHHLGRVAFLGRAFPQALMLFDSVQVSEPAYDPVGIAQLQVRTLLQLGNVRRAGEIIMAGGLTQTPLGAMVQFAEGDTAGARSLLDRLSVNSSSDARAYATMGDRKRAVEIIGSIQLPLQRRFELRSPEYDRIRDDPAFQRLWRE